MRKADSKVQQPRKKSKKFTVQSPETQNRGSTPQRQSENTITPWV